MDIRRGGELYEFDAVPKNIEESHHQPDFGGLFAIFYLRQPLAPHPSTFGKFGLCEAVSLPQLL